MVKKSLAEKEQELIAKIEKAKNDLSKLQKKQKLEIGELAFKYGLNNLSNGELEDKFKKIQTEIKSHDQQAS